MCLHSWLTKQSACANTVGLPISVQAPRSSPKLCQCARPLYQGLGTGPASVPAHLRGLGLILACAPAYLQGLSSYQCAGPLPVPQVLPVHKCTPSPASTQVYPPTFMLCQYTSVPAHLQGLSLLAPARCSAHAPLRHLGGGQRAGAGGCAAGSAQLWPP